MKFPVEVSARHCHLSGNDLEKLFGKGYQLKSIKQLSQPLEFACHETVSVEFGSKKFDNVRIIGPVREKTQIEISLSDAIGSGIEVPVKLSGDVVKTAGAKLIGPVGEVILEEGLIIPLRHLHCATNEADELKLKDGDVISIKIEGERAIVFHNIKVRVKDGYKLCVHLDTDEGNAAGINKKTDGFLI